MPSPNFLAALPFVLQWEGGYLEPPEGPSQASFRGIGQANYHAWRLRMGLRPRDVRLIEESELQALYEREHWRPARCDALPAPLDLVLFDTVVNLGLRRGTRLLQQALGLEADGVLGMLTLQSAASQPPLPSAQALCLRRERFYRELVALNPALAVFWPGWQQRLQALRGDAGLPPGPGAPALTSRAADGGAIAHLPRLPDEGQPCPWRMP